MTNSLAERLHHARKYAQVAGMLGISSIFTVTMPAIWRTFYRRVCEGTGQVTPGMRR